MPRERGAGSVSPVLVTVVVGWTSSRPVVPDEHASRIVVDASDEVAGALLAAQWAASRPGAVMPTSTTVESVVL